MAEDQHVSVKRQSEPLTKKGLLRILRDIRENRRVATVLCAKGANEKCFYFTIGAIRMITVGPDSGLMLGDVLLGRKLIDKRTLDQAEAKRRTMEVPLNEPNTTGGEKRMVRPLLEDVLSMDELVPRTELLDCVSRVVRWELEDVFFWEGATLSVWDGSPPMDVYRPDMEAHKMSFGVYKMLEEVEKIIGGYENRGGRFLVGSNPIRASGPPTPGFGPLGDVLQRAARMREATVERVIQASRHVGEMPFNAAGVLLDLNQQRALQIEPGKEIQQSPERLQQEVLKVEDWIANLLDGLAANVHMAEVYEKLNNTQKAVEYRREIAERLAKDGDSEAALKEFRRILQISERDFPAYERMIELLEQLNQTQELTGVARKYAEILSLNKLFNRAREAWRYFLKFTPKDVGARRQLVDCHLKVRDDQAAAEELLTIADLVESEGGSPEEVRQALVDVLKVVPDDPTIMKRYKKIIGFDAARLIRRVLTVVLVIVVITGGTAALALNYTAHNYLSARDNALYLAEQERYRDAHQKMVDYFDGGLGMFGSLVKEEAEKTHEFIRKKSRDVYAVLFQSKMGRARWLRGQQRLPEAIAVLEELEDDLAAVDATLIPNHANMSNDCQKLLGFMRLERNNFLKSLARAETALKEGQDKRAFGLLRALKDQANWIPKLKTLTMPLRVVTVPTNAQLLLGRAPDGRSPRIMKVPLADDIQVEAEFFGYERTALEASERWNWPATIILRKKIAWSFSFDAAVDAPVVLCGDVLVVGDRAGTLMGIKLDSNSPGKNAKRLWRRNLGLDSDIVDLVAGRKTVVATLGTGQLACFDALSGAELWRREASSEAPVYVQSRKGARVIHLNPERELCARALTNGKELWKRVFKAPIAAAPVVVGVRVLVSLEDGQLAVVDGRNGKLFGSLKKIAGEALPQPLVLPSSPGQSQLLFSYDNGRLQFVSLSTSKDSFKILKTLELDQAVEQRPVLHKGMVHVFGSDERGLGQCLDLSQRRLTGTTALKKAVRGPVSATKKGLLIPTKDALMFVVPERYQVKWKLPCRRPSQGRALAYKGHIIAAIDSRVVAIVE